MSTVALGDKQRRKPGAATPLSLWHSANQEANGSRDGRVQIYRHAMIHAGFLIEKPKDGEPERPYAVCPLCEKDLTAL